ncbi:DsbA family protein [Dinoroseobacter sp. S375]|uniref:DsbA family protein n=1 Tax=Dinoroseobacter sp. S375 TaxID=3415136 RepID=UPI003C7B46A6
MTTRRQFIGGAVVLAGGYSALRYGGPALRDLLTPLPEAQALDAPAGFRALPLSSVSQGLDPLVGLEPAQVHEVAPDQLDGRLCEALFGLDRVPDGVVPIASFSDYACPFCRVLTPRLNALEAASGGALRVKWHELPILGPASTDGARAALAAAQQGRYAETHARLIRAAFQPTEAYLRALSQDLSLDAERLLTDMQSPAIDAALTDSRALAQLFGMVGTPALVVGRTLVQGEISARNLDRLIAVERAAGPPPGCA